MKNRTFQIKVLKDEEPPKTYHHIPPKEELAEDLEDQVVKIVTTVSAYTALTFGACRVVHCLCKIAEIKAGGGF